jgi:hypothetical protein
MSGPRVLLLTLAERTSAKGTVYLAGWLGKARLVGFKSKEPDQFGNPTWEVYAQAPEPRADTAQAPEPKADSTQDPTRNAQRGQRLFDRSRDAAQRTQEPPRDWLDDSEAAIRDLEGRGR